VTDEALAAVIARAARREISFRAIVVDNAPRVLRDAIAPVAMFYLGWKTLGLVAGITGATAVTTAAFVWERRHGRTGLAASIGFTVAVVQALTGLLSGSARWYFAPAVLVQAVSGLVFLGSVAIGRPLAGVFAKDSYPFPAEVTVSDEFRRVFGRISLAWAGYLLGRGALRAAMLLYTSVEAFLVVSIATGFPLSGTLVAWSVWYAVRGLRQLAASGPALR
jgi:hypothetical protein